MLSPTSPMEEGKRRPVKPPALSGDTAPANSAEGAAENSHRPGTPCYDDPENAWMIGAPADPWRILKPNIDPHGTPRLHQTNKTNPALIIDQSTIRPTQNAAGAPRSNIQNIGVLVAYTSTVPRTCARIR